MSEKITDGLSRSVQDYLKAIYYHTRCGEPIGTVELARTLSVEPASVTNMLQKLVAYNPSLVEYQKHRGASLTAAGEMVALRMIRRHRLLEQFLQEVLGYSWEMVHHEAEELEHVISPYMEDRIAAVLGEPLYDPHGEPIPNRSLELFVDPNFIPLDRLQAGDIGRVRQLDGRQEELFEYFNSIGLQLGTAIRITQRNPVDGTLRFVLDEGADEQVIGPKIAQAVLVELAPLPEGGR
ncbi:MAG: metal-dependent transcriptional regulator [Anaerolineales bacterium]|nr:metal-dependent transcriptional regulator [Anaerolineales bacterium]